MNFVENAQSVCQDVATPLGDRSASYTGNDLALLQELLDIYDQGFLAEVLNEASPGHWCRETINRWYKGKASPKLSYVEHARLTALLPRKVQGKRTFTFIDIFAGIGGIR